MRFRIASRSSTFSEVNGSPRTSIVTTPFFTRIAASGMSWVTAMSPGWADEARCRSATSSPAPTRTVERKSERGSVSALFATNTAGIFSRSAARMTISLTAAGQASASIQIRTGHLTPQRLRSRTFARRCLQARGPGPQAQPKPDKQRAEDHRVGSDPNREAHPPRRRSDEKNRAEGKREKPGEAEQPLPLDLLSQPDGDDDLSDAGHDAPPGDQQDEHQEGDPPPEEGEEAGEDADHAFEDEPSPAPLATWGPHGRNEVEDAVDDRVSAEEQHQRSDRARRPDEDEHAEEDRGRAAQHYRPPSLRKIQWHRMSPEGGSSCVDGPSPPRSDPPTGSARPISQARGEREMGSPARADRPIGRPATCHCPSPPAASS